MLPIVSIITNLFSRALQGLGYTVAPEDVFLEHPGELTHGDYATNIALRLAGQAGMSPRVLADSIAEAVKGAGLPIEIADITVAGPGFINIHLSDNFYAGVITQGDEIPHPQLSGKTIMIEYTDPNPFKPLHIGHLMQNAIGESFTRMAEANGARVIRANYQGDVGPHVAKCVWGMQQMHSSMPSEDASQSDKSGFLGRAYAHGSAQYDSVTEIKDEIDRINRAIYQRSDSGIMELYDIGRRWSLAHFAHLYEVLGSRFDVFYYESEMAGPAVTLVREHVGDVFTESEGAIVYEGERDGLHTRVFVTSQGTPTYDAKDLILNTKKFRDYPNVDHSFIITGNEQNEYFRVMLAALHHLDAAASEKTTQIGHGMMQDSQGKKLSSRKGTALTGESLIDEVSTVVREKMSSSDRGEYDDTTVSAIAVGAIKYSILRQTIGKNIIFDFEKSISLEGDSGPYLQYTHARLCSLLEKARTMNFEKSTEMPSDWQVTSLEKILYRYPEVIARAWAEQGPQLIASYVVTIAQEFNTWYGNTKIIDEADAQMGYKLTLCDSVRSVIAGCLKTMGIVPLQKM